VEFESGERDLDVMWSLADPLRRALYRLVTASDSPVSRDAAAEALGVSRQVVAYHLDRMADDGLLDVEFRRLGGREGPGAGRPSKLYRRSTQSYQVSIPPRRYDLAARILLVAARETGMDADAMAQVAHRAGMEIGRDGLAGALMSSGYEPVEEEGETRFRNCPFDALRAEDQETTCRLNHALVEGMVSGAGCDTTAVLDPEDGYCCVRLRPAVPMAPLGARHRREE